MRLRFADTLTNELIVARMAKALRKVENLGTSARLIAYAKANIPSEQIRDFDARAWEVEHIRRTRVDKPQPIKAACELLALAAFVAAILLMTPGAGFAATLPLPADEWAPLRFIGGFLFCFIAFLVVYALMSAKHTPDDEDTRPYGDPSNYDRNPKWRQ